MLLHSHPRPDIHLLDPPYTVLGAVVLLLVIMSLAPPLAGLPQCVSNCVGQFASANNCSFPGYAQSASDRRPEVTRDIIITAALESVTLPVPILLVVNHRTSHRTSKGACRTRIVDPRLRTQTLTAPSVPYVPDKVILEHSHALLLRSGSILIIDFAGISLSFPSSLNVTSSISPTPSPTSSSPTSSAPPHFVQQVFGQHR